MVKKKTKQDIIFEMLFVIDEEFLKAIWHPDYSDRVNKLYHRLHDRIMPLLNNANMIYVDMTKDKGVKK